MPENGKISIKSSIESAVNERIQLLIDAIRSLRNQNRPTPIPQPQRDTTKTQSNTKPMLPKNNFQRTFYGTMVFNPVGEKPKIMNRGGDF